MKIFGELERAQAEQVSTLPTGGDAFLSRLVYLDTIDGANAVGYYVHNGTTWKNIADINTTQTFTNKTLASPSVTGPITIAEQSTPATPSSGNGKIYFKSDGFLYQLNDDGTESKVGSGGGGINYISGNPDAESSTTGWATYADAADATPVDGTGGAATLTFTRTTSSPLRGTGSFLVTTTAANLQGEGASYDFTLSTADQAKVMAISFDYSIASGTYADGDMTVYIYDVTNSTVIQPAGYSILNISSGVAKQIATFQTSSNGTSYRLTFHRAVATASAMTMKIDNVQLGPQIVQYGAPVTDWVSYTPTFGMTAQTTIGKWRRVGDSMEIQAFVDFSGASSGSPTISLPSGYTIDTAKLVSTSTRNIGTATLNEGGQFELVVRYNSTTTGTLIALGAASTYVNEPGVVSATVPATVAATTYIDISFLVPITGWSSTVQMSNDTDTRVVAARMTGATATVTGSYSDVTWTTIASDTHGAMGAINYTIPVSGFYDFGGQLWHGETSNTVGQNVDIQLYNTTTSASILETRYIYQGTSSNSVSIPFSFQNVLLNAGTQVKIQISSAVTGPVIQSSATRNFLAISRKSGPSAIAASEKIIARATLTTVQTAITSKVIPFNTKTFDSHGAFDIVTNVGRFTAPRADYYRIKANALMGSADAATNASLQIRKNGSSVIQEYGSILTGAATSVALNISDIVQLNAGEYVDIFVNGDASFDLDNNGERTIVTISSDG